MAEMPDDLPMFRAGPLSLFPTADFGNRTDTLTADIPAGGKTTARAIARMYAATMGEVDGVRLLSPERLRQATAVAQSGIDEVFGMPTKFGLGYALGLPGSGPDDEPTAFGWGGAGGSFAYGDPATGIAFGMTKNRLTGDFDAATTLSILAQGAKG